MAQKSHYEKSIERTRQNAYGKVKEENELDEPTESSDEE